jgi:hypothetical protein
MVADTTLLQKHALRQLSERRRYERDAARTAAAAAAAPTPVGVQRGPSVVVDDRADRAFWATLVVPPPHLRRLEMPAGSPWAQKGSTGSVVWGSSTEMGVVGGGFGGSGRGGSAQRSRPASAAAAVGHPRQRPVVSNATAAHASGSRSSRETIRRHRGAYVVSAVSAASAARAEREVLLEEAAARDEKGWAVTGAALEDPRACARRLQQTTTLLSAATHSSAAPAARQPSVRSSKCMLKADVVSPRSIGPWY